MSFEESPQGKMIILMGAMVIIGITISIGLSLIGGLLTKAQTQDYRGWILSVDRESLMGFGDTAIRFFGGVQGAFGENPQNLSIEPGQYCSVHIVGDILKNASCNQTKMPQVD